MKINNVNLAFGKRSKQNASEKAPDVFFMTTSGVATGFIAGHLAQKYLPVSDEFFFGAGDKNSVKKQAIKNTADEFVEKFSIIEIQDARVLKTALVAVEPEVKKILPELKDSGLSNLLKESTIKIVDKNDSEELKNSLEVLKSDIVKDLASQDKKELLSKFENINDMAENLVVKARYGIAVKENLEKYKQDLKGFSEHGQDTISSLKVKIKNNKQLSQDVQNGVFKAFKDMVQISKVSQRPPSSWVALPSIILGLGSLGWAVNRKMVIERKKGILK